MAESDPVSLKYPNRAPTLIDTRVRVGYGEVAGFEGVIKLNRNDFGVLTDTPVQSGGGPLVGDTVDITVSVEALKEPAAPTG